MYLANKPIYAVLKSSTLGWILKLLESRVSKIRMKAWSVVCNMIDEHILEMFPSLVDSTLKTVGDPCETVAIKSLAVSLLTKLAKMLKINE